MSRHIPPYPDYDIRGTETWLEEMARKGHFLEPGRAFRHGFAYFVRGNPQSLRYRLVPPEGKINAQPPGSVHPSEEQLRRMEDFGWHYITYRGQYHIYACSDPNAPDMNTDPQVQALALNVTQKRMRSWLLFVLVWGLLHASAGKIRIFLFSSMINEPAASWLYPRLCFLGLLGICLLPGLIYITRFRKKLKQGIVPEPGKPFSPPFSGVVNLLSVLPIVFVFFAPYLFPWPPVHSVQKLPVEQVDSLSLVTVGDLYPEAEVRYISTDGQAEYQAWDTEFTSGCQILEEHFRLTQPTGAQCAGRWTVHRCDTAGWVAVGYAMEQRFLDWIREKDITEQVALPGWDYASVYRIETPSNMDTDKLVLLLSRGGSFFRAELTLFWEDSGETPTPQELAALLLEKIA